MRIISSRTFRITLGTIIVGLLASQQAIQAQVPTVNVFQTNHVWRYQYDAANYQCLDGTGWEQAVYLDEANWPEAPGGFAGGETDVGSLVGVSTPTLPAPPTLAGRRAYFRTRFNLASINGVSLIFSNRIDGNAVFFLNGVEIGNVRRPGAAGDGDPSCNAFGGDAEANTWNVLTVGPGQLAGALLAGENILAVTVGQNSATSSDLVFVLALWSQVSYCPTFPNQAGLTDRTVIQGRSTTLRVTVDGGPPPTLQWFRNGEAILDATNASYTIPDMTEADAGTYHIEAANFCGSASSRTATITYEIDDDPPAFDSACIAGDGLTLTVKFSEAMTTDGNILDTFTYSAIELSSGRPLGFVAVTVVDATTVVLLLDSADPLSPGQKYRLNLNTPIPDRFGNLMPVDSQVPIAPESFVQEGLNGFAGTEDTNPSLFAPNLLDMGITNVVNVDGDDQGGPRQALVRFDLFGNGPGQLPPGTIVHSAALMINCTDPTTAEPATWPTVHRMLVPWSEATATWNSLNGGISADDVEAAVTPDGRVEGANTTGPKMINVTASVKAWAAGTPNYGWAILASTTPTLNVDGFRFNTSEEAVQENRPKLILCVTVEDRPINITRDPQGTNVAERGTVTLTVAFEGTNPSFQWRKDGADIPGATGGSYVISNAIPADSGKYSVRVYNLIPSEDISADAMVTVTPDTLRPRVVSAVGESSLTTILITFSEAVTAATAENTANYTLAGLGAASAAAQTSPTTVRITTAARTFGTDYALTIQNINDTAVTSNILDPNPTVITVHSRARRFAGHEENWRYEQVNDATMDPNGPWYGTAYIDSAWAEGQGLFGLETSAGVVAGINMADPQIRTALTIGTAQPAYYFRRTVSFPSIPANAIYAMRFVADDGLHVWVDGTPVYSLRDTNAANVHQFGGVTGPPVEGTVECARLNTTAGSRLIAVQLKQTNGDSSDILFGAEFVALIQPSLNINNDGATTRVTWDFDPSWGLVSSTNVTGPYTPVAGNPSGSYTVTNQTGNVFFQLLCR